MGARVIDLAIAGALGGFAKSLAETNGRISLPGIEEASDKTKYLHLGFLTNVLLGAIVSAYMAASLFTAFTTGIAAAFVVEKFIEKTVLNSPKKDGG